MKRFVFLTTYERPVVLDAVIPFLKIAVRRANAQLIVLDGGSTDSVVHDLIASLCPDHVFRPESRQNPRQQMQRVADIACDMKLDKYVQVDSDVVLGPDALTQAFEAKVTPQHPVTVYLARGKCAQERDEDGYIPEPVAQHWFADCLRTVRVESLTTPNGRANLRWGFRAWLGKMGSRLRLRLPQVQCQHIGYGPSSGSWHAADTYGSWWITGPCRDVDTGDPVIVDGFNSEVWQLRQALSAGRNTDRRPLCVTVNEDIAPQVRELLPRLVGVRRVLITWVGLWEGRRTWERLGVPMHGRWAHVKPEGTQP